MYSSGDSRENVLSPNKNTLKKRNAEYLVGMHDYVTLLRHRNTIDAQLSKTKTRDSDLWAWSMTSFPASIWHCR
jgi:hypothetical protein